MVKYFENTNSFIELNVTISYNCDKRLSFNNLGNSIIQIEKRGLIK